MTTTARDIEIALAERYSAPEYAFLLQVRNGTGFQRTVRTADALAFSLYPSRGLTVKGFEIKVSKGDWKRELEDPDKAEDIARFCHTWDIVAPKGVVPVEELPLNWGLIELGENGKLRAVKAAVTRDPEPLTRLMIASIMRNISAGMIPRSSIQKQIDDAVLEVKRRAEQDVERTIERRTRDLEDLRISVHRFEQASGVHVNQWNAGDVGAAVRAIMRLRADPDAYLNHLQRMREDIQRLDSELESTIEHLGQVAETATVTEGE